MSYPTTRTHPRTLAQAFGDPYSIECPRGYRMGLSIKTRPGLLQRFWRWLTGAA